jgi:photosystem II stability/assembly factor-like uncharacterized protein
VAALIGLLALLLSGMAAPVPAGAATTGPILGAYSGLDAISCPTQTTCYAGGWVTSTVNSGDIGVVISTDNGGQTWWYRSDDLGVVNGLTCPGTATCFAADGLLAVSTDGGATWSQERFTDPSADGSSDFTRIKCSSTSTCVATGQDDQQQGVVAWTTDGGATWGTALASTGGNALSCPSTTLCVSGGQTNSFATASALLLDRSTDGGATWTQSLEYPDPPVSPEADSIQSVSCPTVTDCVAIGDLGSFGIDSNPPGPTTPVTYTSDDEGATWVQRPEPADLAASGPFEVDCARVVDCYTIGQTTAGTPTIEASTNSGWAWHAETVPAAVTGVDAIACPTYFRCYAVGTTDGSSGTPVAILATTDSGRTWAQQTTP